MTEKKETFRIKRESHQVPQKAKDNLKNFNSVKKRILEAMGDGEYNVPQIAEKINLSHSETLYYMMSLLKFNLIQTVGIDDMDEFYIYKRKQ